MRTIGCHNYRRVQPDEVVSVQVGLLARHDGETKVRHAYWVGDAARSTIKSNQKAFSCLGSLNMPRSVRGGIGAKPHFPLRRQDIAQCHIRMFAGLYVCLLARRNVCLFVSIKVGIFVSLQDFGYSQVLFALRMRPASVSHPEGRC